MPRAHIPFTAAKATGASRAQIVKFVQENFPQDFGEFGNVGNIVREHGGEISAHSHGPHQVSLEVYGKRDFTIYESPFYAFGKQNMEIATQFGHLVLHYPRVAKDFPGHGMQVTVSDKYPDYPEERARREALWFALELLLPESAMRIAFEKYDLEFARGHFMAPMIHLIGRAKKFGLIKQEQIAR